MSGFALFTDVSVNPQRKLGIGGYLLVPAPFLERHPRDIDHDDLSSRIITKKFAETTSTKLELQTVLWALDEVQDELADATPGTLQIYTDSQCVAGLADRRARLTDRDFVAKRSGRPLANAALYREFYAAFDRLGFQLVKVPGHSPSCGHDSVRQVFSCVDTNVRRALSLWMTTGHHPPSGVNPAAR